MTRAEEAALVAHCKECPVEDCGMRADYLFSNCIETRLIMKGYEQAEKDLALTWQDILHIGNLYKTVMLKRYEKRQSLNDEAICKEVLKKLNKE